MKNKFNYDLSFTEAMTACFDGHAVVGENFALGVYMQSDKEDTIRLWDFAKDYSSHYVQLHDPLITKGLIEQKYRIEDILTENRLYSK
jgi:hypothetical protein